jgi:hypothetical protein
MFVTQFSWFKRTVASILPQLDDFGPEGNARREPASRQYPVVQSRYWAEPRVSIKTGLAGSGCATVRIDDNKQAKGRLGDDVRSRYRSEA